MNLNNKTIDILKYVFVTAFGIALYLLLAGCASTYKGGKAVDGTDIEVAIKPYSDAAFQFQFFHYLNGFVFYWEANDSVTITRKTTSNWSMFGIVSGNSESATEISVSPCETQSEDKASDTDAPSTQTVEPSGK